LKLRRIKEMENKIVVGLDYADRRIARKREEEIVLPDKSRRLVADRLAVELFERLGFEYETQSYKKTVYNSKDKSLWYLSEDDFEASCQHKGGFFNPNDWATKYDETTKFLKEKEVYHHFTRADLAFTTDENLFSLFRKSDFRKLLVKSYIRDTECETISAENSRLEVVFYNKTKQLKKVRNEDYKKSFGEKFKDFDQIYRFEIRLKGKDTLEAIPALKAEKINLKQVAIEFLEATEKRIGLPPELLKKLKEAVYAIK
jgi:hypothetical protein